MSDVAEHDPEHEDERGGGEERRVEVGVAGRAVRLHQRAERAREARARDQRRRVGPVGLRQLDRGGALGGEPGRQRLELVRRHPAEQGREAAVRNGGLGAARQLDLAGQEGGRACPLGGGDVQGRGAEDRGRRRRARGPGALEPAERLERLAARSGGLGRELDDAGVGDNGEGLPQPRRGSDDRGPAHPGRHRERVLTPPHRALPARSGGRSAPPSRAPRSSGAHRRRGAPPRR